MKEQKLTAHYFKGINDSTLREGFEFSKANFSLREKMKIFLYLQKIGVDWVEVAKPAKPEIQQMITNLSQTSDGKSDRILSHIRKEGPCF
jgi:isopropylmalate/homocitrate/citramalate synthase